MDARENILLIRLKSIGDILFTLPAVHVLRENFPGAKITFLTSRENESLLNGFEEVNDIIAIDRQHLRSGNPGEILPEIFNLLRRLRGGKFSLVVDFQGYGETAWLAWLSGAPQRWGSVYRPGRHWAYTHGVRRNDNIHPAEWNISLLRECGLKIGEIRNEFILPAESLDEARKFFAANNLDAARPTLYLQPFTSSPHKNWPFENFLALARFWSRRGVQIIFSGGLGDKPRLEPAQAGGFVVAAGVPRLTDAGLMKFSTVVIGSDTGFLHLAVALQRRVLMLIKDAGPGAAVPFRHADWAVKPPDGLAVEHIEWDQVSKASAVAFQECGIV